MTDGSKEAEELGIKLVKFMAVRERVDNGMSEADATAEVEKIHRDHIGDESKDGSSRKESKSEETK